MPVTGEAAAGSLQPSRRRSVRSRRAARRPDVSVQGSRALYDGEDDLRRIFTLAPEDLELVRTARSARNQLGLGVLLAWMRAERRTVSDPAALPAEVVAFVAGQLGFSPEALEGYGDRSRRGTRIAHGRSICRHLGLRPLEPTDEGRLEAFLRTKVAQTASTTALTDLAEGWLLSEGLLRPAATTLDRLVRHVRATAEEELFSHVCGQLSEAQRARLDALCETSGGESTLAGLRAPPRAPSASSIRRQCQQLEAVREVLVDAIDWGPITPNRRRQWAAIVRRLYARDLSRYPTPKRLTLLLAFLSVRVEELTDAIVEMFDALVSAVFSDAGDELIAVKAQQADARADHARLFATVAEILLDQAIPSEAVRDEVFRRVPRERLGRLVEETKALDRQDTENLFALLKDRFPYIRSFVPEVLATLRFASTREDGTLLEAIETLRRMGDEHRRKVPKGAAVGFIPSRWMKVVSSPAGVDRRAWELSLVSAMRAALRAGELTVEGSRRYTAWDTGMYSQEAWVRRRDSWFKERGLPEDGAAFLAGLREDVHGVTLVVAERLDGNTAARVEHGKLTLEALERVELPPSAELARERLTRMLPLVTLPELLLEVDRWTGFSRDLLHLSARGDPSPRHVAATRPALFAVLVAEATNTALATMSRAAGIPYGQLVRVHDWCFREETLRRAIARVIDYHRGLPLARAFGPGTTSSSDGMRFGVSASVLHGRHLPRYFGVRRGVSAYSHVSDQGPQFAMNVINCQLREATFVLDGLLHQEAYRIREHYVDSHGFTVTWTSQGIQGSPGFLLHGQAGLRHRGQRRARPTPGGELRAA